MRLRFQTRGEANNQTFEIVHFDVCGHVQTTSMGGTKYFITFIDDLLKKVWLYALESKAKCFKKFKEFKKLVKMQ